MNSVIEWFVSNNEWVFSGIGGAVIAALVPLLWRRLLSRGGGQNQVGQHQFQSRGDMHVTLTSEEKKESEFRLASSEEVAKFDQRTQSIIRKLIIVHPNRTDVPDLRDQLKQVEEAWFVNISPRILQKDRMDDNEFFKIKKSIFVDPRAPIFDKYREMFRWDETEFRKNVILGAERCLMVNNTAIWTESPVTVMNIGNPKTPDAWIRLQWFLPYKNGHQQPITLITKKDHLEFFNNLVSDFKDLENKGTAITMDSINELKSRFMKNSS